MNTRLIAKLSIYIFLFLLLVLGSLAGYFFIYQKKSLSDLNWRDDVLWAQECGEDGLPCCLDREPACSYGQTCCFDPNNSDRHICSDSCTCGVEGAFCCSGDDPCQQDMACFDGNCLKCGEENQPCCDKGDTCMGDLVCHKDRCVTCGQPGAPCCVPGDVCVGQGNMDTTRTECYNNVCVFCGSNSGIACDFEPHCIPGNLLNNDMCLPCGNYNQPCCQANAEQGYECRPDLGLKCILGFCSDLD